jgi:hypothetical protein
MVETYPNTPITAAPRCYSSDFQTEAVVAPRLLRVAFVLKEKLRDLSKIQPADLSMFKILSFLLM